MNAWDERERREGLISGDGCPVCRSIEKTDARPGTIAELESGYLITQRGQPLRGYCCLVLGRRAVEVHGLDDEAEASMRDSRRASRAVQGGTGTAKMNLEIHGNTIPHLHVHFYPRRVGDRFEGGPADTRREPGVTGEEYRRFAAGLRAALEEA